MNSRQVTLLELEDKGEFQGRHIGPDEEQVREMLAALGHETLDSLIDEAVPANIRSPRALSLPDALTELKPCSAWKRSRNAISYRSR